MEVPEDRRPAFFMIGSLCIYLPLTGSWMIAIGSTMAAITMLLGAQAVAFFAGQCFYGTKVPDRRSRWFSAVRLLLPRSERPPLPPH